ncbi:hypothetical protein HMPREF1987_00178 [Peptostreptococcaceae bacterium oral taxon 113 str. W5053]|nr:hypothetical protein HMPREF1987_00178 [Peptostreptococcaceae bacterium oral taxon 113 str. W5053]
MSCFTLESDMIKGNRMLVHRIKKLSGKGTNKSPRCGEFFV